MKKVIRDAQDRIHSIAGVHELLYNTDRFMDIPFSIYLDKLLGQILDVYNTDRQGIDVRLDCEELVLNINQAIPLGMLISELITNSFKHAFPDGETGIIDLELHSENGTVYVEYRDSGEGFAPSKFETSTSIGFTIIRTLLDQLSATYSVETENGFYLRFKFYQM